jgi:hypothetical protein
VEDRWAPPDHEVFNLVPAGFDHYATHHWEQLGSPEVTIVTFWDVFVALVDSFQGLYPDPMQDLQLNLIREPGWDGGDEDRIEIAPGNVPNIHSILPPGKYILPSDLISLPVLHGEENEDDLINEDDLDGFQAVFSDSEDEVIEELAEE